MEVSRMNPAADVTCKPIDTVEEILNFTQNPPSWGAKCLKFDPGRNIKVRNVEYHQAASADFPKYFCHYDEGEETLCERYEGSLLPKTLICHDMANGYHDDSYIDGTSNNEAYHFYDWAAVDIFCYFSHHFVTVPPLPWINVAHKHNVKVIGTIITEWSDGVIKWGSILASPESYRRFADALVAIAVHLRFEGWLLNVENKITNPGALLEFVRYLRSGLHTAIPEAELIWYDSVTVSGDLCWQNALNEKNAEFLYACDGIFTNYAWTEELVEGSAEFASNQGRLRDLYVGVDVWGRNFYGGGMFNTAEAMKIAFKYGCSIAMFAQAWTYESIVEDERYPTVAEDINSGANLSRYQQFLLRDKVFWDSVWSYLNTRVLSELPFRTSFGRGNGVKQWRYGQLISSETWFNLSLMEHQSPNHGQHGYELVRVAESPHHRFVKSRVVQTLSETITKTPSGVFKKIKRAFTQITKSKGPKIDIAIVDDGKPGYEHERRKGSDEGISLGSQNVDLPLLVTTNAKTKPGSPVRYKIVLLPDDKQCNSLYLEDAFLGGASLLIEPGQTSKLFDCEFNIDKLLICVVTKRLDKRDQSLSVICTVYDSRCKGSFRACLEDSLSDVEEMSLIRAVEPAQLSEVQEYLLLHKPEYYVPIDNGNEWKVRYYKMEYPSCVMKTISCQTTEGEGRMLLGHLAVCPMT